MTRLNHCQRKVHTPPPQQFPPSPYQIGFLINDPRMGGSMPHIWGMQPVGLSPMQNYNQPISFTNNQEREQVIAQAKAEERAKIQAELQAKTQPETTTSTSVKPRINMKKIANGALNTVKFASDTGILTSLADKGGLLGKIANGLSSILGFFSKA